MKQYEKDKELLAETLDGLGDSIELVSHYSSIDWLLVIEAATRIGRQEEREKIADFIKPTDEMLAETILNTPIDE